MSENTNPFVRRKATLRTTDGNSVATIAEVSSKDDTLDAENQAIKKFIPTDANASIDEGLQKMVNILNRQRQDDIRDGVQNPEPELHLPNATPISNENMQNPDAFKFPNITPEMINALNNSIATNSSAKTVSPFFTNSSIPQNIQNNVATIGETVKNDATEEEKTEENPKKEYKPEDVLPLLDSIIQYGYASETFNIRGNAITIRTQFYWEENAIRDSLEKNLTQDTLRVTADAILQQYALASCLVSVGGNYFKPRNVGTPDELRKSLQDRVEFLNTLPSILVYYINKKRGEFNDKVIYLSEHFDEVLAAF